MVSILHTFGWSKLSRTTFHVSNSVVCPVLSAAQLIETPTTNSAFLWYQSQRDIHLLCTIRMASSWTNNLRKDSCHIRQSSAYRQKWVKSVVWLSLEHSPHGNLRSHSGLPLCSGFTPRSATVQWVHTQVCHSRVGSHPGLPLCSGFTPRSATLEWVHTQVCHCAVGSHPGLPLCSGFTPRSATVQWVHTQVCHCGGRHLTTRPLRCLALLEHVLNGQCRRMLSWWACDFSQAFRRSDQTIKERYWHLIKERYWHLIKERHWHLIKERYWHLIKKRYCHLIKKRYWHLIKERYWHLIKERYWHLIIVVVAQW